MNLLDFPEIEMELPVPRPCITNDQKEADDFLDARQRILSACKKSGGRMTCSFHVHPHEYQILVLGPPALVLGLIPGLLERYERVAGRRRVMALLVEQQHRLGGLDARQAPVPDDVRRLLLMQNDRGACLFGSGYASLLGGRLFGGTP